MLIGAMNHPAEDVFKEIQWMADLGLGFMDLTLEPPAAASWRVDTRAVRRALADHGMQVVGHTAFYLPFASAFESVRRAAVDELRHAMDRFAEVGAKWMNVHPDRHTPMHPRAYFISRNIQSLAELQEHGDQCGVGVMAENLPGDFNSAAQLGELFTAVPKLGLHLDVGHANLMVPRNTTAEILHAWGARLQHVHLHDNRGHHDDHLPLGAGNIDVPAALREIRKTGYDATITLEVFSPDRHHFIYSRDVLRRLWDGLNAEFAPAAKDQELVTA